MMQTFIYWWLILGLLFTCLAWLMTGDLLAHLFGMQVKDYEGKIPSWLVTLVQIFVMVALWPIYAIDLLVALINFIGGFFEK